MDPVRISRTTNNIRKSVLDTVSVIPCRFFNRTNVRWGLQDNDVIVDVNGTLCLGDEELMKEKRCRQIPSRRLQLSGLTRGGSL